MPEINEWTFAADVCKTIQRILADSAGLPFSEAKVEQSAGPRRKRRDLTLYDRENRPILTGEIKLPDRPDGQSPYAAPLVDDAFEKANARGVEHFFTWNVNRLVLWRTFEVGKPITERDLEHFNVTSITSSAELSSPGVQTEIRGFLTQFLGRYARILEGTEPIRSKPLDEKFIRVLESALELPILQTRNALTRLYSTDRKFARNLDATLFPGIPFHRPRERSRPIRSRERGLQTESSLFPHPAGLTAQPSVSIRSRAGTPFPSGTSCVCSQSGGLLGDVDAWTGLRARSTPLSLLDI